MAQAIRKRLPMPPMTGKVMQRLQEAALIALLASALFLLLALVTYQPSDPGWSHTGAHPEVRNKAGLVGAWLTDLLLYLVGALAYVFPLMIGYGGYTAFQARSVQGVPDYGALSLRVIGFLLTLAMGCGLAFLHFEPTVALQEGAGGVLGGVVGALVVEFLGRLGGTLFLLSMFLVGITFFTGLSWFRVMDTLGHYTLILLETILAWLERSHDWFAGQRARRVREAHVREEKQKSVGRARPRIEPVISAFEPGERADRERQEVLFAPSADTALPPLALLDVPTPARGGYSPESLEAMSRQVELKLRDFGVEVEVVAVHPGPVITRFELQPAAGVKASRISGLAKDLARSLSVVSVRVVEVIPGKPTVGLEIPNQQRELVSLSEMLNSREYQNASSPLTLALGKDIAGKPAVVDLARMPHLLVAGTTGSGKSVALNAMILSLLYKTTPAETRLIMIDPKMLELSVYEGVPHLLAPVVTDMKEAANALRWCVAEMERRYRLMSTLGVRNLAGYNRKVEELDGRAGASVTAEAGPGRAAAPLVKLPVVVVIVDELADMMMTVGKKVEELIARLAQKARASGLHLILATQRPSVDVITGLIKANIPSRIAFQVSSRVDSRTILDQMGAENLLGNGDMLYLPPGTGLPTRIHGAFVADHEVHRVVEHLRALGRPEYVDEVLSGPVSGEEGAVGENEGEASGEGDELYDQAVRIVTETRRASISSVQRRLKIGYNRAARMLEVMERAGVVGAMQTNGSREVLAPPPPPQP